MANSFGRVLSGCSFHHLSVEMDRTPTERKGRKVEVEEVGGHTRREGRAR
jgi:hypothetical protein